MRLKQEADLQTGGVIAFARIWEADESTLEPTEWQFWDYAPARTVRQGYAGIVAGSSGGVAEFDVDDNLILASGLPKITPAETPNVNSVPVVITTQPTSQAVDERDPVTFRVAITRTPTYDYKWFRNGTMIVGANGPSYTVPSALVADSGAVFHVLTGNGICGFRRQPACSW